MIIFFSLEKPWKQAKQGKKERKKAKKGYFGEKPYKPYRTCRVSKPGGRIGRFWHEEPLSGPTFSSQSKNINGGYKKIIVLL
jgi:hypothetical protein